MQYEILSASAEHTRAIGVQLGRLLKAGDVVAFSGDLGAGKTCCIQGIARGLGICDELTVTSPTYTLIHEYQGNVPMYHFDVYRLVNEDDLYDLGYEEYFYGTGVTLIEWADRIHSFLPEEHLALSFHVQNDGVRTIQLQATGTRAEDVMQTLAHEKIPVS